MRLGGRLQAAIDILDEIEQRKRPAAEALKDWGQLHRFAGSGDRAAIGNIVYDALRHHASVAWRMDSEAAADIAYGALLCDGSMTLEEIEKKLAGDTFAPPPLGPGQQQAWQSRDLVTAPDYIRADVPQWCAAPLEKLLGADWVAEGAALAMRPPLDLRVNSLRTTAEKAAAELAPASAEAVSWFPQALRVAPVAGFQRHPNVQATPAFQKGWFEVQDLGSQIAARLCGTRTGMQVLDYCAGAGGKTMALAADMENHGQIHAYDAEKSRLAPIFERLHRAGVRNTQVYDEKSALEPLIGQMDRVVVDAPCTGTGTWRRRPDAKWRLTESQLQRRLEEQQAVLADAARFIKTGGRLVYITCSLLYDENDRQIAHFLAGHDSFRLCEGARLWQEVAGQGPPSLRFTPYGIVLSPHTSGTDGFYIAVLEKDA